MKAPARAEAGRVLRMARSASECQMSDGMGDGPLGWGATDRVRQNMPHLSGGPAFLVTLSSHALRHDPMEIARTPHANCAVSPTEFDMEMRGKMLNLMKKRCCSSGREISPIIRQISINSATLTNVASAASSTGSNIIFIRQVRHSQLSLQPS